MKIMTSQSQIILTSVFFVLITPFLVANMFPSPLSDYEIIYEIDPIPTLINYKFYECKDSECLDYRFLKEGDSGAFECSQFECGSKAFGYGDYFYIILEFDDGTIRESNIFTKKFFKSDYKIRVYQENLFVEEIHGESNPFLIPIVCFGAIIVLIFTYFIVMFVREFRPQTNSELK